MLAQASIQFKLSRMYWVYIVTNEPFGTLYIGVTNNLGRRIYEHKTKTVRGFTAKYDLGKLVWYEGYDDVNEAIAREKAMKFWKRDWKKRLIGEFNPEWRDLYQDLNK